MKRSRSGGGRRGGRNRRPQGNRQNTTNKQKTAGKQGFFGKLIAFFTGESVAKAPSKRKRTTSRVERAQQSAGAGANENRGGGGGRGKPERVEVTTPRVYVGNLSYDATESDLYELFNGVGAVQNAEVVCNRRTQRSKGFAFVEMQSVDEAKRAVDTLHDQEFMGRKMVVSGARSPGESDDN